MVCIRIGKKYKQQEMKRENIMVVGMGSTEGVIHIPPFSCQGQPVHYIYGEQRPVKQKNSVCE